MTAGERAHRAAVADGMRRTTLSAGRRLNQPTDEEIETRELRRQLLLCCYVVAVLGVGAVLLFWG